MLLDGKLQETIDTEKLRLVRSDPNFIRAIEEYSQNPVKDLELTDEERAQNKVPLYSLTEVYPDFKSLFRQLKKLRQRIKIEALCGSVERLGEQFYHGFELASPNLEVEQLAAQITAGSWSSETEPLDVHAIPFRDKFEGFVQNGALIVAAHKLAGRQDLWANVTYYQALKRRRSNR